MPIRLTALITGEYYHVLNRGNGSIPVFRNKWDYSRFLDILIYYQHSNPPTSFSHFLEFNQENKKRIIDSLKKQTKRVSLITYCLMSNHFHLLLKQEKEKGIYNLMRQFINSYSHYFNIKYKRRGSLFEGRFKAIRIETEPQLLHLSRYIHLNPYSSFLVKDFKKLVSYPYSSLPEYLGKAKQEVCQKEIILENFPAKNDYRSFVLNRADYQKSLQEIKTLVPGTQG